MINNKNIDRGRGFDWGLASENYAKYRDIYPEEFYRRIVQLGLCVQGQKVLDIGTGTGVLPRNMSKYGAHFTGIDISPNQIIQAKRLTKQAGLQIDYAVASAENFDFPAQSFDVVTACQCFMYFDKAVALPRIHAVLRQGGHFAVLFMAWLPNESAIAKRSEELVLKYNPDWTGGGMERSEQKTPDWLGDMFELANAVSFDVNVSFTAETWNGRMKACRGIGASELSTEEIAMWEKEHLEFLSEQPERFDIPHFVTILDLKRGEPACRA